MMKHLKMVHRIIYYEQELGAGGAKEWGRGDQSVAHEMIHKLEHFCNYIVLL